MNQKMSAEFDNVILEQLSLCHGVVQKYLAYIQGVEVKDLFQTAYETNEVQFKDSKNQKWGLKFDIVDSNYMFDISKCNAKIVRDTMTKMIEYLRATLFIIFNTELKDAVVPRPELFMDSKFMVTPHTCMFLYNPKYGRELHDSFKKRIGFVWVTYNQE